MKVESKVKQRPTVYEHEIYENSRPSFPEEEQLYREKRDMEQDMPRCKFRLSSPIFPG
jgi:hypothetical protein